MATYDFVVSAQMPAAPHVVFAAWMSSEGHSQMTGAPAEVEAFVGGAYRAWDGFVAGTTLALDAPQRVVQSWRTIDFDDVDADSMIEVTLEAAGEGTLVTLRHSSVPARQRGYERDGWTQNYFEPMREYFDWCER